MEREKTLSNEESLKIITKMIHTAQGNIKGMSFHFLLWGWVVVIGNLSHFYLEKMTTYPHPYAVWLIAIPAAIIAFIYGMRNSAKQSVKTYSATLIQWIWFGFMICLLIIIFSMKFGATIPALILMITGFATFMTGLILKFKPLIYGGSSFWIFTILALSFDLSYSTLISALTVIVGYLIPGYLLRKIDNA